MGAKYDIIGNNYAQLRKPDPRIAKVIARALGSAQTVLNVGAGTGSYEPADRSLTAVIVERAAQTDFGCDADHKVEFRIGYRDRGGERGKR